MDIRMKTWDEESKEYSAESKSLPVALDPDEAIRLYGLQVQPSVRIEDYPAGTWFYFGSEGVGVRT